MRRSGFFAVAAVTLFLFASSTAFAAPVVWNKDQIKCRSKMAKGGVKVATAVKKGIAKCFKDSFKAGGKGANCFKPVGYDAGGKVAAALGKMVAGAAKCKNNGVQMIAEYKGVCPAPGMPAVIATLADLHTCVGKLSRELTVNMFKDLLRNPLFAPVSKAGQKCSSTLIKGIAKFICTSLKTTSKCQAKLEKADVKAKAGQATNGYQCNGDDPKGKVAGALNKLFNALPSGAKPKCTAADLVEIGVAGQTEANFKARIASVGPLALFAQNQTGLARSLAEGLGQQLWEGGQCPVSTQIQIVSAFDGKGNTNLDTGFTGSGHGFDLPSNFLGHVSLDFSGDPTCSVGAISISPFFEGNRCSNDNTTTCDEPFLLDANDCGGALCVPHFGPPLALSSANTPVCVDNIITATAGTANAGTGASSTIVDSRAVISTGITQTQPCATCDGDVTANDDIRNGTCNNGPDAGNPCDANSAAGSFGATSYDCGGGGVNVSGAGLVLSLSLSTGTSTLSDTSTTGAAACGPGGVLDCQCAVCSGDSTVACNTDLDCSSVGAGTCSSDGTGVSPRFPNDCAADLFACSDTGNGLQGECASTTDTFCDGVTHPDGGGFLKCDTNADCAILNPECGGDCGDCLLSAQRACFLPDITVSGHASQDTTTVAGNFCIPALGASGSAINIAAGLAGPGRIAIDFQLNPFCDSPPTVAFVGNGGNCNR